MPYNPADPMAMAAALQGQPAYPQSFGLMPAPEGQMQGVTGHLGDHADMDKFMRTARPSINIEDARNRPKGILEQMRNASSMVNDSLGNIIESAAQFYK